MIYTVTFNPAIDYVVRLDRPLEVGEVNRAKGEDCVLGGKGINVSGVLAELGCRSTALGFVAGETGAWLERGLAAQGITTDFIHLAQGMTRINVKIKAGQETELNGAGPDIPESAMEQLEAQLDQLAEGDILILAGSIPSSLPQTTYERLLARLEGHGVHAVVDATRDLLVNVLQYHPFLIKPNNHELGEIVGRTLTTDAEITAAARTLQEKGARNVLVSMAGDGALLLDEKGRSPPHRHPQGQGGQQRGRRRQHGGRLCGGLPAQRQLSGGPPAGHCLRQRHRIQPRAGKEGNDRCPVGDDLRDRRKQGEENTMRITELFTAQSIALDEAQQDRSQIIDRLVELQATHGNIKDKEAYKNGPLRPRRRRLDLCG